VFQEFNFVFCEWSIDGRSALNRRVADLILDLEFDRDNVGRQRTGDRSRGRPGVCLRDATGSDHG
jgi:hypothetical protein